VSSKNAAFRLPHSVFKSINQKKMHIGGNVCDLTKGTMKHGVPLRINSILEPILFAGDSSVLISSRNVEDFCSVSNLVVSHMIKWFAANKLVVNLDKTNIIKLVVNLDKTNIMKLVVNLDKTNIMKFITKKSHFTFCIGCKRKVFRRDSIIKISWFTNW
jgi:hypothetical protein